MTFSRHLLVAAPVAACLAMTPVWAQEAPAPSTSTAETPAAPAADAAAPEAAAPETAAPGTTTPGTAAPEAPAAGTQPAAPAQGAQAPAEMPTEETAQPNQAYIAEEHGDWQLRCVKAAEGPDPCQLYQLLKDSQGGSVAEISLTPVNDPQAKGLATIITPLETLLTAGLTLSIDGSEGKRIPFDFCTRQGCWVRVPMREADLAAFRRGNVASFTIVPVRAADQKVAVTASLNGFTAAWDALMGRLSAN